MTYSEQRKRSLEKAFGALPRMNHRIKTAKIQDEQWERPQLSSEQADYLRHLQAGDDAAWKQFMKEWAPRLYHYVSYNLRGADDAQDVLNETLLAVVQSIGNFDGKVALSTFIYSIAYHKIADYWRAKQDTAELPEWLSTAGPNHTSIQFYEALAQLSEEAQQVLMLRYHVGLSVTEIAEILGRSYKATESLLSRVRRQFEVAFLGNDEA